MDARTNPYAPPRTDAINDVRPDALETPTPFFAVSPTKLVVMSLLTMSFYELYWFYKNWKIIRDRTGQRISPFWRTVFQLLFCYQLFGHVRDHEAAPMRLPAGLLAVGFIIVTLLWRLPDPYWMVSYAAVFFLIPVQSTMNQINARVAPSHDRNERFSAANYVAMAIGLALHALGIIGTFFSME